MGNVICRMGNRGAQRQILLDAHLDQVGLIVTQIEKDGFLRIDRCGGTDRRVLPGSPVTVYGREPLTGVMCCMPPHLVEGGEDKVESIDRMAVDVGLSKEEAEALVSQMCIRDSIISGKRGGLAVAAVTSEMEIFFDLCPCIIYAVTGSDGKTTTTTIISEFLKAAGKNVHLGGNIGRPLLPEIERVAADDVAVVEPVSYTHLDVYKRQMHTVVL